MKLLRELLTENVQQLNEYDIEHKAFDNLWNKMVPIEGEAETEYGEAVRALGRLGHDFYNNGYGNAVDIRINIEVTDSEFNEQILNLEEYLEAAVEKMGSNRSGSRQLYSYFDDICRATNENSGDIRSETDMENAAYKGAQSLSRLIDELQRHEEIYNSDDESDDYGWLEMSGRHFHLEQDDIEFMFDKIEKGLDDISSVADFEIDERETWYTTELWANLNDFAGSSDAPLIVMKAIRFIKPSAELASDDAPSDEFFKNIRIIQDWLVSLYEETTNNAPVLNEEDDEDDEAQPRKPHGKLRECRAAQG